MAFDIDNKISQIKKDLERLEAELDSFNRANYDGSENSNIRKKQKQIKEKQLELLKYRNVKAMMNKDTMEILKLSGFTVDSTFNMEERDYKNEYKHLVQQRNNYQPGTPEYKKIQERLNSIRSKIKGDPFKDGDIILPQHEANDEDVSPKFKKVMEEFGKGELKSSSGEKVTDPKQAKAIAYSEAKDDDATEEGAIKEYGKEKGSFEDGGPGSGIKGHKTAEPSYTSRSGYNFEEPKVIEAAIKKVKASGHADPYYLMGLERALERSKKERGMKDDCGEKVFTKGTEDAERSVVWVKPSGIEYKIGDIIQFKGQKVKISKITGNVIEATVMDACTKDADPKVVEAEAMISLFGGVR